MSVIRRLIVDTRVQALVIVVVKIIGDAALRVRQIRKNGPLADFEHFGFEARPEAFGLCVVVAVAAAALRAQGLVVVQSFAVGIAAVLPALPGTTPVGVDEQAGRGRLRPKGPLQGAGHQFFGHGGSDLPAHHLLAGHVLKGAQVGPLAIGQWQIRDVAHPYPVGLGRLGLVEQSVVRGVNALGCSACRPRRRMAVRSRCRPTR